MKFQQEPGRIYATDPAGKTIAEVTFPEAEKGIVEINHTFVDESLRGQGTASLLLAETVRTLRAEGKKARLTCSYAKKWFAEHPENSDLLQ